MLDTSHADLHEYRQHSRHPHDPIAPGSRGTRGAGLRLGWLVGLSALLLQGAVAGTCLAQQQNLPEAIVAAANLDAGQQDVVNRYVETHAPGLMSKDSGQVTRARKMLMRPLTAPNVSVDFRFKYADAASPKLAETVKAGNEHASVNALLVASAIATDSASRVLEDSLKAKSMPVRYAAVRGLGRSLSIAAQGASALTADRAIGIVELLAQIVETEKSNEIVDAALLGLESGIELTNGPMANVRPAALTRLGAAGAARMKSMVKPGPLQAGCAGLAHAGAAIRQVLVQPGVQPGLPANAKTALSNFGDEMLRLVVRHIEGKGLEIPGATPEELARERQAAVNLVRLAQGITVLASGLDAPKPPDPADELAKGKPESDASSLKLIDAFLKR